MVGVYHTPVQCTGKNCMHKFSTKWFAIHACEQTHTHTHTQIKKKNSKPPNLSTTVVHNCPQSFWNAIRRLHWMANGIGDRLSHKKMQPEKSHFSLLLRSFMHWSISFSLFFCFLFFSAKIHFMHGKSSNVMGIVVEGRKRKTEVVVEAIITAGKSLSHDSQHVWGKTSSYFCQKVHTASVFVRAYINVSYLSTAPTLSQWQTTPCPDSSPQTRWKM